MKAIKTIITLTLMLMLLSGCISLNNKEENSGNTITSKDGSLISYGTKGQGDIAIVFVHCWTCDHTFWTPQVEYFAKQYQVVWIDLAGHGLSLSARTQYTMQSFGEDVAAVVNKLKAEKIILVGHSMGGPVSIEAAKLLGNKVIGIVGVDTFYTPFIYPKEQSKVEAFVKPFKKDFAGSSKAMVKTMFTPDVDAKLKASITEKFSGKNKKMGISALYDIFKWNNENVPASLDKFSDKLKNINGAPTGKEKPLHKSVVLIPGVGHFVPQVKPDEFNAALNIIIIGFTKEG